jgi:hypothetical protein
MPLNDCVRAILCGLLKPAQDALRQLIQLQITLLQALLANLEASLAAARVILAPIIIARDAAIAAREAVLSTLDVLPTALFAGCIDLGTLVVDIRSYFDDVTAPLDRAILEANAKLTAIDELQAKIADVSRQIDHLTAILDVLVECPLPDQIL